MSDEVLELVERANEPIMQIDTGAVISAAKRTRHRRRALALVTGVVGALVVASVTVLADWAPRANDVIPAGPLLPTTPTLSSTTQTSTTTDSFESEASQTWGPVHVMSQQPNRAGGRPVLYLTPSRMLCIGTVDAEGHVTPSVCRLLQTTPSDSFGVGYAWSMEGDLPSGVAANEFIAGVVAGDVTTVVARTERGDVTSHLAPAPDPALGQLYWVETSVPILGANNHAQERSRVAYRGTKVAFTCAYFECVSE